MTRHIFGPCEAILSVLSFWTVMCESISMGWYLGGIMASFQCEGAGCSWFWGWRRGKGEVCCLVEVVDGEGGGTGYE